MPQLCARRAEAPWPAAGAQSQGPVMAAIPRVTLGGDLGDGLLYRRGLDSERSGYLLRAVLHPSGQPPGVAGGLQGFGVTGIHIPQPKLIAVGDAKPFRNFACLFDDFFCFHLSSFVLRFDLYPCGKKQCAWKPLTQRPPAQNSSRATWATWRTGHPLPINRT